MSKLSDAPEWTPGPGAYKQTTDFIVQDKIAKKQPAVTNDKGDTEEELNAPWNQKGYS